MLLNCGVGENSWESLGLKDHTLILKEISPEYSWKDWCWSWSSNTLATWCEELTHWKRSWCWERLKAGGEGDDRRWDGWMASPIQWAWVWARSRSWWWTGKPEMLQSMGLQRVRYNWGTELNCELMGKSWSAECGQCVLLTELFFHLQIFFSDCRSVFAHFYQLELGPYSPSEPRW